LAAEAYAWALFWLLMDAALFSISGTKIEQHVLFSAT
jgi:hypothetical protein